MGKKKKQFSPWRRLGSGERRSGFLLVQILPVFLGVVLVGTALGMVYGKIVQSVIWNNLAQQALTAAELYCSKAVDKQTILEEYSFAAEELELPLRDGVKLTEVRLYDKRTGRYLINSVQYVP